MLGPIVTVAAIAVGVAIVWAFIIGIARAAAKGSRFSEFVKEDQLPDPHSPKLWDEFDRINRGDQR